MQRIISVCAHMLVRMHVCMVACLRISFPAQLCIPKV